MMKKVIKFILVALAFQFILCHMSAQISIVGDFTDGMMGFYEHIIKAPFEIFYFNQYVYLFGWLIFGLFSISSWTKVEKPKAEMKGNEHGSNGFQTKEEMVEFAKNCTSKMLPYIEPTPTLKEEEIRDVDI